MMRRVSICTMWLLFICFHNSSMLKRVAFPKMIEIRQDNVTDCFYPVSLTVKCTIEYGENSHVHTCCLNLRNILAIPYYLCPC